MADTTRDIQLMNVYCINSNTEEMISHP